MSTQLTFVHALSPLHAGIGQGIGVIDLPIAREKATGIPFLPGSSLKGTLRALCPQDQDKCSRIFGPETTDIDPNSNYASSVQFSDLRLLLLPIRSLAGTFAWVTSPYVLRRLLRDMTGISATPPTTVVPEIRNTEQCFFASQASQIKVNGSKIYLEDIDLQAEYNAEAETWAKWISRQLFPEDNTWQQYLLERFCIIHDDVLSFLLNTATEITARIKLNEDSKTVKTGGLWYEEALPTESVLWGLVSTSPIKATDQEIIETVKELTQKPVQLGGKATVGRGICKIHLEN